MAGVVRELPQLYTFFKDRYFGTPPTLFTTEKVIVDYDDGDGNIDCNDDDCTNDSACKPAVAEICDNKLDDDLDGKVDCDDDDCANHAACKAPGTNPGQGTNSGPHTSDDCSATPSQPAHHSVGALLLTLIGFGTLARRRRQAHR